MSKRFLRFCSIVLSLVMVFQILPTHVWAQNLTADETVETAVTQPVAEDTYIVGEIEENRTEFSKEFLLNNGLHVAAVYGHAVHYQEDGQWKDIDNTLKFATTRSGNVYTNTAGNWQVSFPQNLSAASGVTITKGEYTLSFRMAGELRSTGGNMEMDADASAQLNGLQTITAQEVAATVETVDLTAVKEDAAYEQIVTDKLYSRLSYANVYENTDVIFDLNSNQVKESVVMERYNSTLSGYSYILAPGTMTPVLNESGEILLMDGEEVIMMMPAPFLEDNAGERSYDVEVMLDNIKGTYILAYILPTEWLADENRQWPVILDPAVTPTWNVKNIQDATVCENGGYAFDFPTLSVGYVGGNTDNKVSRAYLKFVDLPKLSPADVIVDARVYMQYMTTPNCETNSVVEVHKVYENWTSQGIAYNDYFPDYNPAAEDFQCPKTVGYHSWDVTDIARGWYEGENTGMMFKMPDSVEKAKQNDYKRFWASDETNRMPQMIITFRNNNGLEGYWDYTSFSAGRAGAVSVNNYTGNLIVTRTDMAYSGNRMPASLSFTYNANDHTENIGYGNGWRSCYSQTVTSTTIGGTNYYCWIDGDGTRIYFYNDNGTWKDENGLEYTLTVAASSYTIRDRDGNQMVFDSQGRLVQVVDGKISSNKIQITYVSGQTAPKIGAVTDGAGRKYTFSYGSDGNLSSVKYSGTGTTALETVTYSYSSNNLTTVKYADSNTAKYTYTSGYLSAATGCQSENISVVYSTNDTGKVKQMIAKDGTTLVSSASFGYGKNYTKVTDHNGRWCIYQFNNLGNTVSIYNHRGQALYGRYSEETPNQLVNSSRLQDTVTNLLSTRSYTGSWSQSVTVIPGKDYTLSGIGTGVLKLTAGSVTQSSTAVAGMRNEVTITVPSGTTTLTASGTTGFSDLQLEQAEAASRYNMLRNTDMTSISGWTGTGTETGDGRASNETESRANLDSYSLTIGGSATAAKKYTQTLSVAGAVGDKYSFGTWVKAASVPLNDGSDSSSRRFGVQVRLLNGGTEVAQKYIPANEFCDEWQFISGSVQAGSAYNSVEFSLIYDYNANRAYFDGAQLFKETFDYVYAYDDKGRIQTVTDLEGNVTSYTYRGNSSDIASITLPGDKVYSYTYNSNNLLTGTTSATGIQTTHTYDSYGNNKQTTITYSGNTGPVIQSDQTYTSDGNFLGSVTGGDRNTVTYNYNSQKSTLTSVTDACGNTTSNTYDSLRRLKTVTSGNANVSYTYNKDRLSTIYHSGGTNGTTYSFTYATAGLTDKVSVGSYQLVDNAYNGGTWTLASQVYGNGDAWRYTYNDFDDLVSAYTTGGTKGTELKYFYNSEGALARIEQYDTTLSGVTITGRSLVSTERYYYDTADRAVRTTRTDADGDTYEARWEYDHNDNITQLVETINGNAVTTSYTYDGDNQVTSLTSNGLTTTYTYDGFGRMSGKTTAIDSVVSLTNSYTFRSPGQGFTSTQVESMAVSIGDYVGNYSYTYDANGNITSISERGSTTTYEYDSLNQLIRENNQKANKTWIWTYDTGGNITNRKEYAYTTGQLAQATDTVTYAYGDSAWGDLLTTYDGKQFSYDDMGNLTSDGTWSYAWDGRQLASMTDGAVTWHYKYDANGLRTEKSNGTTTYKYYYSGSKLMQMSIGDSVTLKFGYEGDTPRTVNYNGSTYYYITNLQGDVVSIVNRTGRAVATYTYDAWGNVLSSGGVLSETLAQYNPLRYRGYVYDSETGLYYVSSRYYDPEIGRWINADGYVSTGQGVLGSNMFAYCGNNPVNRVDPTGQFWKELWDAFTQTIQQASGYFAVAAGVSQVDTPAPGPADVASGILLLGGVLVCAGIATYTAITAPAPSISIPKAEEKAEAIPTTPPSPTVIYRYGGTNPGNLTPKAKDKYSGLSFSTVPMPGAAVTTIEALNATGVVYAVQDGPTHVSVRPVGATMEDWINAGSGSIWTQAVKSVVVKWDGGY